MAILLHGRLLVVADKERFEIAGPSKPFLTSAGVRKFTVALEDSTLITFHPTDETDVEKIEEAIFIHSPAFKEFEAEMRLTDPNWNRTMKEIA
jgi:hypothetical protein